MVSPKVVYFFVVMALSINNLCAATDFKDGVGKAMGFGAVVAFIGCFYFGIEGIIHWRQGGSFGRDIIGLILCAASLAICSALFTAFGMSDAIVEPQY